MLRDIFINLLTNFQINKSYKSILRSYVNYLITNNIIDDLYICIIYFLQCTNSRYNLNLCYWITGNFDFTRAKFNRKLLLSNEPLKYCKDILINDMSYNYTSKSYYLFAAIYDKYLKTKNKLSELELLIFKKINDLNILSTIEFTNIYNDKFGK